MISRLVRLCDDVPLKISLFRRNLTHGQTGMRIAKLYRLRLTAISTLIHFELVQILIRIDENFCLFITGHINQLSCSCHPRLAGE